MSEKRKNALYGGGFSFLPKVKTFLMERTLSRMKDSPDTKD